MDGPVYISADDLRMSFSLRSRTRITTGCYSMTLDAIIYHWMVMRQENFTCVWVR